MDKATGTTEGSPLCTRLVDGRWVTAVVKAVGQTVVFVVVVGRWDGLLPETRPRGRLGRHRRVRVRWTTDVSPPWLRLRDGWRGRSR